MQKKEEDAESIQQTSQLIPILSTNLFLFIINHLNILNS